MTLAIASLRPRCCWCSAARRRAIRRPRAKTRCWATSASAGDQATEGPVTNGAIYQSNGSRRRRARTVPRPSRRQVGDIVTVQIAQKRDRDQERQSEYRPQRQHQEHVINLFGLPTSFGHSSCDPVQSQHRLQQRQHAARQRRHCAEATVLTTVSTMVHRIRPNGDLVIAGNDEVKLVGGKVHPHRRRGAAGGSVAATRRSRPRWPRRISSSAATARPIAPKMGFSSGSSREHDMAGRLVLTRRGPSRSLACG